MNILSANRSWTAMPVVLARSVDMNHVAVAILCPPLVVYEYEEGGGAEVTVACGTILQ